MSISNFLFYTYITIAVIIIIIVIGISNYMFILGNCKKNCINKNCGNDGCGGNCGICANEEVCDYYGKCCTPNCTILQQCGDNGCGGVCGICSNCNNSTGICNCTASYNTNKPCCGQDNRKNGEIQCPKDYPLCSGATNDTLGTCGKN